MWFGYQKEESWHPVPVARVNEILLLNKKGKQPATLLEDSTEIKDSSSETLNQDLEQMDQKYRKKTKRNKSNKNKIHFEKKGRISPIRKKSE